MSAVLGHRRTRQQPLEAGDARTPSTAAQKIGGDVHVLVAGISARGAAEAAAKVAGRDQGAAWPMRRTTTDQLAENLAALVVGAGEGLQPRRSRRPPTFGKNFMPRVAALLDVRRSPTSARSRVADTFVRPIYAGNALATVQSTDRSRSSRCAPPAFDAAAATGGSAPVEAVAAGRRHRPVQRSSGRSSPSPSARS